LSGLGQLFHLRQLEGPESSAVFLHGLPAGSAFLQSVANMAQATAAPLGRYKKTKGAAGNSGGAPSIILAVSPVAQLIVGAQTSLQAS
jgi:hypothetical protein